MSVFKYEKELLLCCARPQIDFECAQQINALLREQLDWDYVLRTAAQYGVIQLLYCNLRDIQEGSISSQIMDRLRHIFQANAARNLLLANELLGLLKLLETNNIPAMPFKGPALAVLAYKNLSLRTFGDLDILVHPEHVLMAKELFIKQGYRLTWQPKDEKAYLQAQHQFAFTSSDGKSLVEIQWGFAPKHFSFPIDLSKLWDRAQPIKLNGKAVLQPSPDELLLLLCGHGGKHCWCKLGWISDVAFFIETYREKLDWNRALERAKALGGLRLVLLGMLLAQNHLKTILPEVVTQALHSDKVVVSLAIQVSHRLFSEISDLPNPFGSFGAFERHLFYIKSRERLCDKIPNFINLLRYYKIRMFRWIKPNINDRKLLPLPASLDFLYYFLRPIRLVGKVGLILIRTMQK